MTEITKFENIDLSAFGRNEIENLCKYLLQYVDGALATNNRLLERLAEDPLNAKAILDYWSMCFNEMNEQLAAYVTTLATGRAGQSMQ